MKLRKLTAVLMALLMAVTALSFTGEALRGTLVHAEEAPAAGAKADRYFYNQLNPEEKKFYDAIRKMYEDNILRTGRDSLELTGENAILSQNEVAAYTNGFSNLLNVFGAARDAFYFDHPGIFYVDFSLLTIRVTQSNGIFHAYIGAGREDNYFNKAFTSEEQVMEAIKKYDEAVDAVVREARELKADADENLTVKMVEFVHDHITMNTSYKLEDVCQPDNLYLIRTSYGSIVRGEAVCEGYARALKEILDRLDIPCVLVQGLYRHSENVGELHMWTNVSVDGVWYGVDPTMDDPTPPKGSSAPAKAEAQRGVDGYETREYLLVGDGMMSVHHYPSPVVSPANREFSYPTLSLENVGVETTHFTNGLDVVYDPNYPFEDTDGSITYGGAYKISFQGMGYQKAKDAGYYMLARFNTVSTREENYGEWEVTNWSYIEPQYYPSILDTDTELVLAMPHIEYVEFGITDLPIRPPERPGWPADPTYYGDPGLLIADTGMLHNENGDYKAPPYPEKTTPYIGSSLNINDGPQHMEIVFDDRLQLVEGQEFEVSIYAEHWLNGVRVENESAEQNSIVGKPEFDGSRTVSFDFTPSPMWMDDSTCYTFTIKGIVGVQSQKPPIQLVYIAKHPCAVCCYKSQGYDWNVFGKPALLENDDLSTNGWVTNDGTEVSELLKHRMVLVATDTTPKEHNEMEQLVEDTEDVNVLSSQTYKIDLTVCKAQVIKAGQGVRVTLGFPEGYGPDDAGVTFKAYHFQVDEYGDVIGVEEIGCVVTPYGLLVTCTSFSPFAIVAVEKDPEEVDTTKTVIISDSSSGKIIVNGKQDKGSIFDVAEGESMNVVIRANEGYAIETVSLPKGARNITGKLGDSEMTFEIKASDLEVGSNIFDATFVAESVKTSDILNGESVVVPAATVPTVKIPETRAAEEGKDFIIEAVVSEGNNTYQWYKDNEPIVGQTSKDLVIAADDVNADTIKGSYKLKVTNIVGTSMESAESGICSVTQVIQAHTSHNFDSWKTITEATCSAPGMKQHVCSVCGYTETEQIEVKQHNWSSEYTIDESTCIKAGTKYRRCLNEGCHEVTEVTRLPLAEHQYGTDRVCDFCGHEFVAHGDVNGDNELTAADALAVMRDVIGHNSLTHEQAMVGDINGDGRLTLSDALLILRRVIMANAANSGGKE